MGHRRMGRGGAVVVMMAMVAALGLAVDAPTARADGAVAVGSTGNVAKDGVALGWAVNKTVSEAEKTAVQYCKDYEGARKAAAKCELVTTFKDECFVLAMDPKAGTPGVGWAIGPTVDSASERALALCQMTAGADRRNYCKVDSTKCDGVEE